MPPTPAPATTSSSSTRATLISPTRGNPRGAYYENLVVASPIKLQGVGPGGFQGSQPGSAFVAGSIIDASAIGGDTAQLTDWLAKVATFTWDGNQAVNEGQAIYLLASQNATNANGTARQYTAGYKAAVDGFDIRGATQNGFPGNINDLTGAQTGLPPTIVTQGGAIFANAYVRNLQITNNVVENNGSGYGTIRLGTPDLPAPDTNQHNENVRIANNRIISNAGTNLAGGIGLFAGSDNYEVAGNDICANFSLEYGGGMSVYGRSPNGKIHHNRIYFNMSNDEGGGIMIAGELPQTVGALSPGTGPVDIYDNQIQANLANDDGGGIRFLMAGGTGGVDAMNVYNNMIANNVSTHEGGGIGIDDAPNVRVYNNTIMKNLTTATAVTSDGFAAPAGLSTSANSDQLQATLPAGSATFSNPVLFNNIFWDNRAGTRAGTTVTGVGLPGDSSAIDEWDLGVADMTGQLSPTNSVLQQNAAGLHPYVDVSNSHSDPAVVDTYDLSVSFATWRQNPGFVDATLVAVEAPPGLLGDYHLAACPGSPACNLGAPSKGTVDAPSTDFDDQARPSGGGFDSGADEFVVAAPPPPTTADLSITKTDGVTSVAAGASVNYTIVVSNAGPSAVTNATVTDTFPASLTVGMWTCAASSGSNCSATGTGNGRTGTVSLPTGGSATFTATATLSASATGSLANTASVAPPAGITDPNTANNSATDTDTITTTAATVLYMTLAGNATLPGTAGNLTVANDDAISFNGTTYSMLFDGSDVLPTTVTSATGINGFVRLDNTHALISFASAVAGVPGVSGTVDDSDIVMFTGTFGSTTTGTFSMWFDGSDVSLTTLSESINAFSVLPNGAGGYDVVVSTAGGVTATGISGSVTGSDLFRCSGGTRGTNTSCAWSWYFDGSDVGLSTFLLENIDGVAIDNAGKIYLTTLGNFSVPGVSGNNRDVFVFTPTALGSTTTGTYSSTLFFNGSAHGLTSSLNPVNGIGLP